MTNFNLILFTTYKVQTIGLGEQEVITTSWYGIFQEAVSLILHVSSLGKTAACQPTERTKAALTRMTALGAATLSPGAIKEQNFSKPKDANSQRLTPARSKPVRPLFRLPSPRLYERARGLTIPWSAVALFHPSRWERYLVPVNFTCIDV